MSLKFLYCTRHTSFSLRCLFLKSKFSGHFYAFKGLYRPLHCFFFQTEYSKIKLHFHRLEKIHRSCAGFSHPASHLPWICRLLLHASETCCAKNKRKSIQLGSMAWYQYWLMLHGLRRRALFAQWCVAKLKVNEKIIWFGWTTLSWSRTTPWLKVLLLSLQKSLFVSLISLSLPFTLTPPTNSPPGYGEYGGVPPPLNTPLLAFPKCWSQGMSFGLKKSARKLSRPVPNQYIFNRLLCTVFSEEKWKRTGF